MTNPYETRGGAREGAGRPSAGTIQVQLRLHRETAQALGRAVKNLPHEERWGARSKIADAAIRARLELPPL
jgi:hypothetical protein